MCADFARLAAGILAGMGRPWTPAVRWSFLTFSYGLIGFLDDLLIIIHRRPLGLKAGTSCCSRFFRRARCLSSRGDYGYPGPFSLGTCLCTPRHPFFVISWWSAPPRRHPTDGLDGLAAGSCVTTGLAMGVLAAWPGIRGLPRPSSVPAPALSGLIAPAQVFMGDTGSLALGAALGTMGILSGTALFLPVVGGIFVAEVLSVIIQVISFRLTGKRVFRMSPLHHHYELGGMVESKVVVRFWLIGALLALLGLAGYKL